jgi:hypothetical protein
MKSNENRMQQFWWGAPPSPESGPEWAREDGQVSHDIGGRNTVCRGRPLTYRGWSVRHTHLFTCEVCGFYVTAHSGLECPWQPSPWGYMCRHEYGEDSRICVYTWDADYREVMESAAVAYA